MDEGVISEGIEREEIIERYETKRKSSFKKASISILLAGTISIGGMVSTGTCFKNPYEDAKIRYDEISQTLNVLEDFREKSDIASKLGYLPEEAKPYLEMAIDKGRIESLDKVIKFARESKSALENSNELKNYEERNEFIDYIVKGFSLIGVGCIIIGGLAGTINIFRLSEKREKELDELRCKYLR